MAKAPTCQNCGASHWSTQACKRGTNATPVKAAPPPDHAAMSDASKSLEAALTRLVNVIETTDIDLDKVEKFDWPEIPKTHGGARPGAGRPRKYFTDEDRKAAQVRWQQAARAKRANPYTNDA